MTKPIQIKNDDIVRDIRELAALRQKPITEVVGRAVRSELRQARREAAPEARERAIDEAIAQFQAAVKKHGGRMLTDDDLYDENGLPR